MVYFFLSEPLINSKELPVSMHYQVGDNKKNVSPEDYHTPQQRVFWFEPATINTTLEILFEKFLVFEAILPIGILFPVTLCGLGMCIFWNCTIKKSSRRKYLDVPQFYKTDINGNE